MRGEESAKSLSDLGRELSEAARRMSVEMVERFIENHGVELLRIVRSYASSAADAEDAFQNTLEVMLTKAPATENDQQLLAWAVTVARNEALMQHRRRKRVVGEPFESIAVEWTGESDTPDEILVENERFGHGGEALRRISPDQARCLLLRADGFGYDEICRRTGFSRTKVNRLITDGRHALRDRLARIDSGSECRRLSGVLSMMADGEASAASTADAELHLAHCLRCQTTLREYRLAPKRLAAAFPVGVSTAYAEGGLFDRLGEFGRQVVEGVQSAATSVQERVAGAIGVHQGAELATAQKLMAITAVSASLVGGGIAVEHSIDDGADDRAAHSASARTAQFDVAGDGGGDSLAKPDEGESKPEDRDPREPRADEVVGQAATVQPRSSAEADDSVQSSGDSVDPPREFSAPPSTVDEPVDQPMPEFRVE